MNPLTETRDAVFDGRLTLLQSRSGYRFSLDALLLAYFVTVKPGERIVDLGTGNGVVALILAHLYPASPVTGVELQSGMVDRAKRNVELNRLQDRVKILQADVRQIVARIGGASFDVAVCNPPYRKLNSGRMSADAEKQAARHETRGDLRDFLRASAYLLRSKGRVALCYATVRLIDLIAAMRELGIEPKRLRLVHSYPGREASLVLVEGIKGARAGLLALPPLTVYRHGKKYSDEVASIIAGLPKIASRTGSAP